MKKIAIYTLLLTSFTKGYSQISTDIETGIVKVNRDDASSSWKNSSGELNGIDGTLFSYAP